MRMKKFASGLLDFTSVAATVLLPQTVVARAALSVGTTLLKRYGEDEPEEPEDVLSNGYYEFLASDGTLAGSLRFEKLTVDSVAVHADFNGTAIRDNFDDLSIQYIECLELLQAEGIKTVKATIDPSSTDNLRKLLSQGGFKYQTTWEFHELKL